jgi:deoxyribodipyrimidine photo-lyase
MKATRAGFTGPPSGLRIRQANAAPVRPAAAFVLYWMIAARRPCFNFALDRAIAWGAILQRPVIVLEPLRCDYPWASDRLHRFVIDGMAENAKAFNDSPIAYYAYVEPAPGDGRGLLAAFADDAAIVITDDFPCFFLPKAIAAAARQLGVRLEAVDSNGVVPMASATRPFSAAVHYRRHMQRELRSALTEVPQANPLGMTALPSLRQPPAGVVARWPQASGELLAGSPAALRELPIDHTVPPVRMRGGWRRARQRLSAFVSTDLSLYHERHNHPDDRGTSRLSPYLHFGHIGAHEIFAAVMRRERWNLGKLAAKASGVREGWWGVGPGAEAFLDQLLVWRELAFNGCATRPLDYDKYESLPPWALKTLAEHTPDPRPHRYSREQFERAETHDPVWNAAQRGMVRDGWFHNYMRMLWGKKILEWSATPDDAFATMVALMNKWSLDGRDPNSYSGYMWTLGKYDRPWPEREVYGTVRSMSSANTARKVRLKAYIASPALDFDPTISDE